MIHVNIEQIPEAEFQEFFSWLPPRTKLAVKSGLVDWRTALVEWYEKFLRETGDPDVSVNDYY